MEMLALLGQFFLGIGFFLFGVAALKFVKVYSEEKKM